MQSMCGSDFFVLNSRAGVALTQSGCSAMYCRKFSIVIANPKTGPASAMQAAHGELAPDEMAAPS
jgi:hypothetical protein